jgi:hypothetical protein
MKNKFLVRWFWTLTEYLMIFPVLLIFSGLLLPDRFAVIFTLTLPLHTLLAIVIARFMEKFRNIIIAGIGMVYTLLVSCAWYIVSFDNSGYMLVYMAGTALFFFRGISKATEGGPIIFFYTGGLVLHGISLFFLSRIQAINPYFDLAVIVSILYVTAAFPLANRYFLITESQLKNSLNIMPKSVVRGNRIIVLGLLAVIGFLSIGKYLLEGLNYLVRMAGSLIEKLIRLLATGEEDLQPLPEQNNAFFDDIPRAEPNKLAEIISDIISTLFTLAVLFFVIKYIIRNHKKIISSIMEFFSRLLSRFQRWSSSEQSYTDKQEFLLKFDDLKRTSFLKRLFRREKRWKDMKDNASRTRFIYTKFVLDNIRRGFRFRVSDTPSETVGRISGEMKGREKDHALINESYNQVRYGKKEISDDTVNKLKDKYL